MFYSNDILGNVVEGKMFEEQQKKEHAETEASLQEILWQRENTAKRQAAYLKEYGGMLICLTLNIAGPVKRFPLADRGFREGCARVEAMLKAYNLPVYHRCVHSEKAGQTGFWNVEAEGHWLKRQLTQIEDFDDLGRILDLDLLQTDGRKITRQDVGAKQRQCFLCTNPAVVCGRSRAHTVEELQNYTRQVLSAYFWEKDAQDIGRTAVRALLYEVSATPKPGLVDRYNSGAHSDMDFFTFLDSATVLYPYFFRCAQVGMENCQRNPRTWIESLRVQGILAEKQMLDATNGVNTHKGAIYSLGSICVAAGILSGRGQKKTPEQLCELAGELGVADLESRRHDFSQPGKLPAVPVTQNTGARKEVSNGFPHVLQIGLPSFLRAREMGKNWNDAGVFALLCMVCKVIDTNIVRRKGAEALARVQHQLQKLWKQENLDDKEIEQLDALWSQEGISPGGCADLLALTYFLYFYCEEE